MMTTRTKLGLGTTLRAVWLVLVGACGGQDDVVGENGCYGTHTVCNSNLDSLGLVEVGGLSGRVFEVATSRTIEPTWTLDLPCSDSCFAGQVEPAPDAGVWTLMHDGPRYQLVRVDRKGVVVHSYSLDDEHTVVAGPLSVDEGKWPVVGSWQTDGRQFFFRVGPNGKLTRTFAPRQLPNVDGFFLAGPGGSVRAEVIGDVDSTVQEFDDQGVLIWKQDNLRDAPVAAYSSQDRQFAKTAALLTDGGLAFLVPKRTGDSGPAGVSGDFWGITRLDINGNLLWDAYLGTGEPPYYLDAWKDAGVVVVSAKDPDTLGVYALRKDGKVVAAWGGKRSGFFSIRPLATSVDAAGNIYLALVVGEHDAPRLAVCRLNGSKPAADADCATIDMPTESLTGARSISGFGVANELFDMTSPEPGSLVLTLSPWIGDVQRARLVRVDF